MFHAFRKYILNVMAFYGARTLCKGRSGARCNASFIQCRMVLVDAAGRTRAATFMAQSYSLAGDGEVARPADALVALIARAGGGDGKKPPVERWNPPFCGDIDMAINADGSWSYMGSPIGREALVKLFASVLRRDEDGCHYLVTPVEKVRISVADAPFLAVEMHSLGQGDSRKLTFRTNVGDLVAAGPESPLRFRLDEENDGLVPYVLVRGRLEARLTRPLLYDLAELIEEKDGVPGVWSGGAFFPLPDGAFGEMERGGADQS